MEAICLRSHPAKLGIELFGAGHIGPIQLSALAIPIVLALAFVSWHFVEAPALRLRDREKGAAFIPITRIAA